MGLFSEALAQLPDAANVPEDPSLLGEASKGLSRGLRDMGASALQGAGMGAEYLGHTDTAKSLRGKAKTLRDSAEAFAPEAADWNSVQGVGQGVRWAMGKAGEMVPMVGGAAVGGMVAGPAGAMASMVPSQFGAIDTEQQADPHLAAQPIEKRAGDAFLPAMASSALQAIPGESIIGRLGLPATKTLAGAAAANVGKGAAIGGVTTGGADALVQQGVDPNAPTNWDRAGEAAVGGAVAVGGIHALHAVPSYLKGNGQALGDAMGSAKQSISERLAAAKTGAAEKVDAAAEAPAGKKVRSAFDDIGDMVERGKAKFDDTVDKVMNGDELGAPADWLKATTDEAKQRMADFSDNEKVKAATQWGKDMLSKMKRDDPRRDVVETADPATPDGQLLLAGEKKKFDASEDAGAKIDAFSEAMDDHKSPDGGWAQTDNATQAATDAAKTKPTISQRKKFIDDAVRSGMTTEQARTAFVESMNGPRMDNPTPPEAPKLSADYSGTQKLIADAIKDNGIVSRRPELFDTDKKIEAVSRNLRILMERLPKGPLDETTVKSVTRVFGDDTDGVINSLKRTLGVELTPAESEHFFGNLRAMKDINDGEKSLHDVMRSSLTDEAKTRQQHTEKDAEALVKHARGQAGAERTAERAHFDRLVDEHYKNNYGDKADQVRAAVEKAAGTDKGKIDSSKTRLDENGAAVGKSEGGFDESGNRVEAPAQDVVKYGLSKPDAKGNSKSEIDGAAMLEGSRYAKQHELDLKAKFPDKDVRFERLPGSDHGHVVVENRSNPGEFNAADLAAMKHDTKKYPNSPSRLKVGDHEIDAVKVSKTMRDKMQDTGGGSDAPTTKLQRDIEGFKQGIAQLTEQFGKAVVVPDAAVVAYEGKKAVTWGDAKKRDFRTADDKLRDSNAQEQAKLREAYKTAKAKGASEDVLDGIKGKYKELVAEHDLVLNSELGRGDDIQERSIERRPTSAVRTESKASGTAVRDHGVSKAEDGSMKVDKDGNIHAARKMKEQELVHRSNQDGSGHYVSSSVSAAERVARSEMKAGIANWRDTGTAPAIKLADRATRLLSDAHLMSEKDRTALYDLAGGTAAEASATVNALARKYKDQIVAPVSKAAEPSVGKERSVLSGVKEGSPDPKALAAKKAAFLERAASGDKALVGELAASTDAKGLQRAVEALARHAPDSEAMKAATERLTALVQDPDTAYGLQTRKYSLDSTKVDANGQTTAQQRDAVKAHIQTVLGNTVKVAWKNLTNMQHAGDYTHSLKLIRLSVHALDPMSTGYHESLHAFFAQLRDAGAHDITSVLEKAAQSSHVMKQLTERYKNNPEVLKQLKDPEERAAYMYQTWASDPTFKISLGAKGVFGRIADFIHNLMGTWTNDQRALHIMQYFNTGEYARDMSSPSAVRHALMETHRSQVLETAKSFAEPLGKFADAVLGTGGDRLRDTKIPALNLLADIMKREHTARGGDQGFIQSSRVEATKLRTQLGELLHPFDEQQLHDAMEALHTNTPAASAEAQAAAAGIKKFLRDARTYMQEAGVDVGDLGPDYFPRVWDTHYISKNQQAFRDMLEPYIRSGQMKGSADKLISQLTTRGGVELGIESREPGMQHTKERLLDFITPQDAAQFMEKNLHATLSSYAAQAARKAEWTRRLGNGKLETLLEQAKQQGATKEHLGTAEQYMKGIDGTLGDDLNPHARRIMGNMIVYQNVRLLPTAAFSMLIDPNGVMVRGGTVGDAWSTFTRGMKGIKDTFKKDGGEAGADQATKWAELVGVVDSAMMSHVMGDVFSQGMVGGTAQKINNAFFKYNLVEGLNRNFRIGATEAAMKFLGRHAGGLDGLGDSTHSARWMEELGLQKGDIVVTPEGHIALTQQEGLQAAQVQRVHAAINQWVDGAVLRPDAADKPIWMNDPHYALVSHLKQFVFSFQKTILERTMHEMRHGNYTPMMALASYVPIMIAADMAKGALVTGGGTPAWQAGWTPADYLEHGVERAGLFGVGQFGLDIAKSLHRGDSGVGALTGPTIEQLGDVLSTLGGHKQFGNTVLDAMPANTFVKGLVGKGEAKADPMFSG